MTQKQKDDFREWLIGNLRLDNYNSVDLIVKHVDHYFCPGNSGQGDAVRWVKATTKVPYHLAFYNIPQGHLKDCRFPVRFKGREYYMAELFDQRLKDDLDEKISFSFNGEHHFENQFSEIEWLDASTTPTAQDTDKEQEGLWNEIDQIKEDHSPYKALDYIKAAFSLKLK